MIGDAIPILEEYHGVGIHADQSPARVARVKADIDAVLDLGEDARALFDFAGTTWRAPEARLLAAAMVRALFALAEAKRRSMPPVNLEVLKARVAGLGSSKYRSPTHYASIFDARPPAGRGGPEKRETPLPETNYRPKGNPDAS